MQKDKILIVKDLCLRAGNFKLNKMSLEVIRGHFHAIVGPTGSGKTLLLETIAGLRQLDAGQLLFDGNDITGLLPEKRHISYLPQDLCLFPNMTVRQNITYSLRMKGMSNEDANDFIRPYVKSLQIEHILDRLTTNLSGGEKQRTALARALVTKNKLILLDEPFSSLNLYLKRELWRLLKKLQEEQELSFIMVTHSLEEAMFLGNEVSLVSEGKNIQSGTKSRVFHKPRSIEAAKILGVENFIEAEIETIDTESIVFYSKELKDNIRVQCSSAHKCIEQTDKITRNLAIKAETVAENRSEEKFNNYKFIVKQFFDKGDRVGMTLKHPETGYTLTMDTDAREVSHRFRADSEIEIFIAPQSVVILDDQ